MKPKEDKYAYMVIISPRQYAIGVVSDEPMTDAEIMEGISDRFYDTSISKIYKQSNFSIERRTGRGLGKQTVKLPLTCFTYNEIPKK